MSAPDSNATRQLLNSRPPADYRNEWTRNVAEERSDSPEDTEAVLVFQLGEHWMGLNAVTVEHVTEMQVIHSIPHRSEEVLRGIVNIRGELMICVSLGHWFGFHQAAPSPRCLMGPEERLVVTRVLHDRFAFPVSRVRGVHAFESSLLAPPQERNYPVVDDFTRGEIRVGKGTDPITVHVLDHFALFKAISQSLV
ncbi:MAG: chemotaxis-related protein WspD [Limisphaerales bacterium]|jgi:chemotaxis-related protein WspD